MKRPLAKVDAALTTLQRRGLAERFTVPGSASDTFYYRLHDLSWSYARTLFLKKKRGKVYQKTLAGCRKYIRANLDNLDMLDAERANLLGAANKAEQIGDDETLIEIMNLLAVEGPYFAARGYTALSLDLLKAAIAAAKRGQQLEKAHFLLGKLGNAYRDMIGDLPAAFNAYYEAFELAQAIGNPRREALLLAALGTVRFKQHESDFDSYMQRASAIGEATQDDFIRCYVAHYRGYQAMNGQPPDHEEGRRLSDEAAQIAIRLGFNELQFYSLINRGGCEFELHNLDQALATHRTAYERAEGESNFLWMAEALFSMGEDYHALGDSSQAQQAFNEAIGLWRKGEAVWRVNQAVEQIAKLGYFEKQPGV